MPSAADPYSNYEKWKGWGDLFRFDADAADYFERECAGIRVVGADVLEIGFGAGAFLAWAGAQGARTCGVEVIPPLVAAARERGIEILPADLESVERENRERFDTVVAFDVFEHLSVREIVARLATIETLLKPGGHLLLRFPNAQSPFGLAPQFGDPTHLTGLSRGVFEQLIQGSSWAIVRYRGAARAPGRSMLQRLVRFLRFAMQDLIAWCLNAIYTQRIPWDAVVVLVLRKGDRVG